MKHFASRLSGIAFLALIAVPAANAGDFASNAADAESLLSAGNTGEALVAFDAAANAFWKATPLTFRKSLFVDAVKGYGDYTPRSDSSFAPGATLQVYAEPVGYGWSVAGNDYKIALSAELEIHDKKGLVLTKAASPAKVEKLLKDKSREFQMTVGFTLPQIKPGEYTLVMKVTDAATAKTSTIVLPFSIAG